LEQIKNYINCKALVLSGDVPLISNNTLNNLYNDQCNKLLVTELLDPTGCGRIILDNDHNILKIVEQKDCNDLEKNINLVNCGIYQIKVCDLLNLIPLISNNNKAGEYYLTDIIQLMIENNIKINYYNLPQLSHYEIKNVNSQKDLNDLNDFVKNNL
jgi:bifunctional N-acetylglucosamine-1-phosphate-uridyltransferase/glucosamine-1-phosphate-acetyltransferase GlmU-like protein